MRTRGILLLAVTFLLVWTAGCATTAKYDKILYSWMNSDVNDLFQSWGPPSNEFKQPNGNTQYTWLYVGGTRVVSNYNSYLNMTFTNANTYWCKTTFTADRSGRIISWRREGNACKAK